MKRAFLIFFLILLHQACYSQDSTGSGRVAIKLTPTSLFNPNIATIQPGVEWRFHRNASILVEYGFQFEKFALAGWNWEKHDWQYKKIRSGARFYFISRRGFHTYSELNFFFVKQGYTKFDSYVQLQNGQMYQYEKSEISKNLWGFSVNGGMIIKLNQRLHLEYYSGLGLKWRTIGHTLFNPVEVDELPLSEWFPAADMKEGKTTLLHADWGFKISYSIGRK
ncbi:MAG: DUF3575 domain-containing protein [Saprospiraceae bacterium]|nr:MAG: DUF3575 domain-containing protein [Saprospiraceae bacterium]